jgi:hypothetical protein
MEQEYVTVAVHEEFAKRIEDENSRQNHRINTLEESVKDISKISINVERLAANIEAMTNEIKRQGDRLTAIEEKPAKRWDAVITGIIGAIVGALGAALASGIIH